MILGDIGFPNIGDLWNGLMNIFVNFIPNIFNAILSWAGRTILGVIYSISSAVGGVLSSLLPTFGIGHDVTDPTSFIPATLNQAHAWDVIAPVHEIMSGVVVALGFIALMYLWSVVLFLVKLIKGLPFTFS